MNLIDKLKTYTGRQLSQEEIAKAERVLREVQALSSRQPIIHSYDVTDERIVIEERVLIANLPPQPANPREKRWDTRTYTPDGKLIMREMTRFYPDLGGVEALSITTRYDPPGSFFGTTTRALVKKA
ncbi:TPA: hypothetical protein HA251_05735 [Candidatus Woesearchaeota archaeon]|nr:hypothetical protein [Candidatus Woesearchaeota archaeon]